ncbi:MAG: hypothetical protein AAF848_02635 [Pseudomonadota bacterium]
MAAILRAWLRPLGFWGQAPRWEFWGFLVSYIVLLGYVQIRLTAGTLEFKGILVWLGEWLVPDPGLLSLLLFAGLAWGFCCLLAVSVRRLRDVGSSPLLLLGPPAFIGMALLITFLGGSEAFGVFYLTAIFGSFLILLLQMLRPGAGGLTRIPPEIFD